MDLDMSKLSEKEQMNLQLIGMMTATTGKYTAKEITASQLAEELVKFVTDDVVFKTNYTPSWEPLRPLFSECRGIKDIIARYDYEEKHEKIKTGVPEDFAIAGDVMYFSQNEIASFFDKEDVQWNMMTKVKFKDGKVCRFDMYLDYQVIEDAYNKYI